MLYRQRHLLLLLWLLALGCFQALSWTSHSSAAFDLNGFDLAEQIRYHPAIQAESPTLRSSLLLWLALPFCAAGLVSVGSLYEDRKMRWLILLLGFLLIARLLPPENALRSPRQIPEDDYARTLMIITLGGGVLMCLLFILRPYYQAKIKWVIATLSLFAAVLPWGGFQRALQLLRELGLGIEIGGGFVAYSLLLVLILLLCLREGGRSQESPTATT